jgi:hypothetical protein
MGTQTAVNRLIAEWLARAHPTPKQARQEWSMWGVALLPLGERFAAVKMASELVHAAIAADDPAQVPLALGDLLVGCVIYDRRTAGGTYYALIQWHAGVVWAHEAVAPCLGDGTYLGVPHVDRRAPPGSYWMVAPRYEGDLCRPGAVAALVETGRQRLAEQVLV